MRDWMKWSSWAPLSLTMAGFLTIVYLVSTGQASSMGAMAKASAEPTPDGPTSVQATLSFSVYRETVEPIFLEDRGGYGPGVSACVTLPCPVGNAAEAAATGRGRKRGRLLDRGSISDEFRNCFGTRHARRAGTQLAPP